MKFIFPTRFIVLASKKGGIVKKGIIPVFLILFAALILAVSCEKAQEALGITISGTVTDSGQPVEGAYVLLVNNISDIIAGSPLSNGMITGSNGKYTIIQVEDGVYYVVAIDDTTNNITYDFGVDPIGWYGHTDGITGLTIPDSLIINGEDKSGIDIDTMYAQ